LQRHGGMFSLAQSLLSVRSPAARRSASLGYPSLEGRADPRLRLAHFPPRTPAIHDAGWGYDVFGLDPKAVRRAARQLGPMYRRWFRVDSRGAENIPREGAAVLAANHAGLLPLDGAMIYLDVILHTDPSRVARSVADKFVPRIPFVGTMFARTGVVSGSRANAKRLLQSGELLLVFPEGARGVGKPWSERGRLQAWSVGHAELAMRHRAPVIPVAVIGSDEQWPMLARLERFHAFGIPWLPIPLTPVPLPVRYHIRYGAPIHLAGDHDDPRAVDSGAARVRDAVAELLDQGRRERRGWFR
jgi:1-acyl-sn-glycerol-3-phosphate acyltransferase